MKKVLSLVFVFIFVFMSAVIPAAAFNEVVIPTYDSYPDDPTMLPEGALGEKTDIITCENMGKVFFINNNGLFELNPETGDFNSVESYNPITIRSKYFTNSRLYISSNKEPAKIFVFNLNTLSYEESISIDYPTASALGVDDNGRIYFSASFNDGRRQTDFVVIDREGNVLSKIDLQNNILKFSAFDSNESAFYTVSEKKIPNPDDSTKTNTLYVMCKGYFDGNELLYNEDEYTQITDDSGNNLSETERLNGQLFAVDFPTSGTLKIYDLDSDGFEKPYQTINRFTETDADTIGTLAAYLPDKESFIIKYNSTVISEINKDGEIVHSFQLPYVILSVKEYKGKTLVFGVSKGQYYYNLIDWKEPTKITLNSNEITITPDSVFKLSAESDAVYPQKYSYFSQDTSIADVTTDGTVYGWRNGETYITCVSDSGFSAQCKVTVAGAVQGNGKLPDTKVLNNYLPYNIKENNYTVHSWVCRSYLTEKADGTYETVSADDNEVIVTEYDKSQKHITGTKTIDFELPLFGGFYSGEKYNFIIFGQNNPDESTETEVLRVVKYSKNWERLTAISAFGWNTAEPFHAGSLRMTECNGKLYVHTCHLFFKDEDGDSHQGNMSFVIDEENDVFISSLCGSFVTLKHGYVSHSFNQFIDTDDKYIYRVDHGDTYPRAITLTKCDANGSITKNDTIELMHFWGFLFDNNTGASVGGMAVNTSDILVVGNSDGKFNERNEDDIKSSNRNAFVISVDKNLEKSSINWLTEHTEDDNIMVGTPQIIKIGSNKNLVMWTETERQNYTSVTKAVTVNHKGEKTSEIAEFQGDLSDCQPILCADKSVRWFSADREKTFFYSIYPQDIVDYQSNCFGDVNNDGVVDILDATLIQKFAVDKATLTDEQKEVADVNGDGVVDILDSTDIQKYTVDKITEFKKKA